MIYTPFIRDLINTAGLVMGMAGVAVILLGALVSTIVFVTGLKEPATSFRLYRKNVGRSILLGLELLVGGDIIRTVSVEHPGLVDVLVLALIVIIRTAMSWAMEVELEGRWPWLAASLDDKTQSRHDPGQS
ncbi:DUF1622 domain-containing protein [Methylocystis sp. ATCC 49242]|uniref:DUF1622 domain-containing protein n=1 Tax=Methylocystis sp. ATCC 49242 TaxID=622637 RepID=UPI0001F86F8A|nr:DUF1622 domain-containing protein [Methylocystis sp. ATCC 49242]